MGAKVGGWRAVLAPLQAQAELGLCPTFSLLEGQPAALSSLLSLPPAHSPPRFWLSPEQGGGVQGREPLGGTQAPEQLLLSSFTRAASLPLGAAGSDVDVLWGLGRSF